MAQHSIRLALVPTDDKGLLCVCCGRFPRARAGVFYAIVPAAGDASAGVHAKCLREHRAARATDRIERRKAKRVAADTASEATS